MAMAISWGRMGRMLRSLMRRPLCLQVMLARCCPSSRRPRSRAAQSPCLGSKQGRAILIEAPLGGKMRWGCRARASGGSPDRAGRQTGRCDYPSLSIFALLTSDDVASDVVFAELLGLASLNLHRCQHWQRPRQEFIGLDARGEIVLREKMACDRVVATAMPDWNGRQAQDPTL